MKAVYNLKEGVMYKRVGSQGRGVSLNKEIVRQQRLDQASQALALTKKDRTRN